MTAYAGPPTVTPARSLWRRGDSDLRVGDAERDRAVEAIGEHFAAGRLDHSELEERIEAAWRARTRGELDVLFADLPSASAARVGRPTRTEVSLRGRRPPVGLLAVLLVVAVVIALPGPAFLLIPLLWLFVISRVVGGVARGWAGPRH